MEYMVLVVPTIREDCITRFLRTWGDGLPYDGGYWGRLKSAMKIWTELTK